MIPLNREPYATGTGSHQWNGRGGWLFVLFSFSLALALAIMPLPSWALVYRPEWVALVLIYWCLALPQRIGIAVGWGLGLLLDVLTDSLLGQHALALAVVAFLTLKLHRRIATVHVWQQSLIVFFLIATEQMLVLWVKGVTGHPPWSLSYFIPSLASMLFWPGIFALLRALGRNYVTAARK
ncbi:MAG: rod shape-determining protein MreD [Gammaproteobacteria bacterium]